MRKSIMPLYQRGHGTGHDLVTKQTELAARVMKERIRTDVSPCADGEVLLFVQVRAARGGLEGA